MTNNKERNMTRNEGKLISSKGAKKRKNIKPDVFTKEVEGFFV